jgi:hypothetical protein
MIQLYSGATEEYNGTSWTAGGALLQTSYQAGASGTQTAGLLFGGQPGPTGSTHEYNGTSWTTIPATMNTARRQFGSSNADAQTAALCIGGETPAGSNSNATEEYTGAKH